MCFNLKTSILTFSVGVISGITAVYLKKYTLGLLIICYSLIQFSEIFIWYGLENDNDNINKFGTNLGKYLLPMHNIAIGLGLYLSTNQITPLIISLLFYICILFIFSVSLWGYGYVFSRLLSFFVANLGDCK